MAALVDPEHLAGYLRRLGVEAEPPSAEALARLHQAHAERITYEALWVHLREPRGIDPAASLALLAAGRRGGYCYHLNGALSLVLEALGYQVTRHVAGVYSRGEDRAGAMTNHLVLTVAGLPSDANPDGRWYVDVGLGDALHSPLPLLHGTYEQGPFTLTLGPGTDGLGEWHFSHDPAGAFEGFNWREAPAAMAEFAERHTWLSTDPASGFVRFLCAERREADAVDVLKGLTYRRRGRGAEERTLASKGELLACLHDVFALDLSGSDPDAVDAMWRTAAAAHAEWDAAGRP